MISLKYKILMFFGIAGLISALSFIIYKQIENSQRQTAIETQSIAQKALLDGIVRSQDSYATKKNIEDFAKQNDINLKTISDDLDKLHASVNAINVTTAESTGQTSINLPSTSATQISNPIKIIPVTVPCNGQQIECPTQDYDHFGYLTHKQNFSLHEHFNTIDVPIGSVNFTASSATPWGLDLFPREYKASTVIATDENGRIITYNKLSVKEGDQEFNLPITSTTETLYPSAHMSWFNPRAFLLGGIGANTNRDLFLDFGLSIGLASYGKTLASPQMSFMQIGATYQTNANQIAFIITPISYNLSGMFPKGIVDNTFIGPSLGLSTTGATSLSLNISVGL